MCVCSPLCPIGDRPKEGVECEGCEMEFGCFKLAIAHEKGCTEYAQFHALETKPVDAAVDPVEGAATVAAAAEEGQWSHMVKPTGKKPTIPDATGSDAVRQPRISAKGGTSAGLKRSSMLAETSKGKKPRSASLFEKIPTLTLVHAKIDFKEGDNVRVPWGKPKKAMKGAKGGVVKHDATVVKIDWDNGTKPVLVKFGSAETAWVAASCVESTEPNQGDLASKAAQVYPGSQHSKTNEPRAAESNKSGEEQLQETFYRARSGGVYLSKCCVCGRGAPNKQRPLYACRYRDGLSQRTCVPSCLPSCLPDCLCLPGCLRAVCICLSVCPAVCPTVSVRPAVCPTVSVCPAVCPSDCMIT